MDANHLNQVAASILETTGSPTTDPVETKETEVEDEVEQEQEQEEADVDVDVDEGELTVTAEDFAALCFDDPSSETESEATPRSQGDPESSFESYDGHGATQDAYF